VLKCTRACVHLTRQGFEFSCIATEAQTRWVARRRGTSMGSLSWYSSMYIVLAWLFQGVISQIAAFITFSRASLYDPWPSGLSWIVKLNGLHSNSTCLLFNLKKLAEYVEVEGQVGPHCKRCLFGYRLIQYRTCLICVDENWPNLSSILCITQKTRQ